MSVLKCLCFRDLEGLTEVFGGMSAGMSGRKLPLWAEFSFLKYFGGSQKGGFQKGGFGGCSPGTKTGTRVRSPKPPFWKPPFYLPMTLFGVDKRAVSKRVVSADVPQNENRQNHPFTKPPFYLPVNIGVPLDVPESNT